MEFRETPAEINELQQPTDERVYVTKEEFERRLSEQAWRVGEFQIVPRGAFWADMSFTTSEVSPGAYALYVLSAQDNGEAAYNLDCRRSRLGLDVTGPAILLPGDSRSGGEVEIDFLGNFVTENRASVQLRHAYWEEKNSEARLLVGQTWDVVSPLLPGTLDAGFGYYAGNIGFRRAQFRAERYTALSDSWLFTWQGSLNQNIVADFPTDPGVRREPSNWPQIQGRVAATLGPRGENEQPVVLGVSGHIGEVGFDFLEAGPPPLSLPPENDARFETWSLNIDARIPISDRCGWQGEFFRGTDLSSFLGGIGQGVCPCLRVPIRSTGGWCEVWYHWTPRWHSHVGYGIDDPVDQDSLLGRTKNQFAFANLTFDVTDRLVTGLEVSVRETLYHDTRIGQIPADQLAPTEPGRAVVIDWMVRYGF